MTDSEADGEGRSSSIGVEVLLFVLGVTVLAYVGGAFSATFRTFPYPQLLERPFKALAAQKRKQQITEGGLGQSGLWHRQLYPHRGLTRYRQGETSDGYTLYTSAPKSGAVLVNMKGEVVHDWKLPFREVWSDPPHVSDPSDASFIYWRRAHVYPNGDLLASYASTADTPYGYGLVKVDTQSNLIWSYAARTHHDFEILEDGSIYVLTQGIRNTSKHPVDDVPQLPDASLTDYIVRLSPEGEPQARISMLEAITNSKYREMLQMYPKYVDDTRDDAWDILHTNTVTRVGADFAEHHAFAEPDHLMVSFRANDAIGLIDPEAGRLVWADRGFWWQQHDPKPLSNGNILVFDNNGHGGPGGFSRILEFNPRDNGIEWSYVGTEKRPFASAAAGSHHPLPNGNVLVTSSMTGRLFEVTRDKEIVWEYHNPIRRKEKGKTYVPTTCSAHRIPREQLTFLGDAASSEEEPTESDPETNDADAAASPTPDAATP